MDADIDPLSRVREAVGPEGQLLTDIHGVYNLNDPIRLGLNFPTRIKPPRAGWTPG